MLVVLTHRTSQSTDGGVQRLLDFLGFVDAEWQRFALSSARTMNDLKVPLDIEYLFLGGKEYRIGGKRQIWFKKAEKGEKSVKGYNPDRFYVTDAFDQFEHPHQLNFDLSKGSAFDEGLVQVQPIGRKIGRSFSSKGPLVRE